MSPAARVTSLAPGEGSISRWDPPLVPGEDSTSGKIPSLVPGIIDVPQKSHQFPRGTRRVRRTIEGFPGYQGMFQAGPRLIPALKRAVAFAERLEGSLERVFMLLELVEGTSVWAGSSALTVEECLNRASPVPFNLPSRFVSHV